MTQLALLGRVRESLASVCSLQLAVCQLLDRQRSNGHDLAQRTAASVARLNMKLALTGLCSVPERASAASLALAQCTSGAYAGSKVHARPLTLRAARLRTSDH